ncbi:protein disulfide isomerase, putative [Plasmodium ovale]|uniref:protein disulfide-isomerase n=2 Tax=Plasmodium ovale TaxID=36330 RepID=A0A1A8VTN0_PLAOA|nr:protein disulfide isomerase (PDI-11) [Plasmodium ovale curtisi]SBS91619.1 protein disulfide isomerase (PDI-11) [Plasmodium ovale curtisi]SCP04668.1 protein disulfide isomerase, putative [Plasmodium ovale]
MEIYKRLFFLLLLVYLFSRCCSSLYANVKEIKTIDCPKEFEEVLKEKKICLVQFYATWCRVSRGFSNDFINIAKTLKDDITFVAVKNEDIVNKYKIETFPSIQLFFINGDKKEMEKFDGNYKIKDVVSFIYDTLKNHRLGELNIDTGKNKSAYKKKSKSKNGGKVIVLNGNNFYENVLKNDDNVWFIFFYAHWCGHSKPIHPMFDELAKKVAHLKNAKIAKIDTSIEKGVGDMFQINHFPSFRLFPSGNKNANTAVDYNEARTVDNFYNFFLKYYTEKKELIQLTSQEIFDEYCEKNVCLLAILPNKEDTENTYFKSYIDTLTKVNKDVRNLPVNFLWTQAGDQLDIIQKLNLTFGFPTVIAISSSKNVYSILKGNYSEQSIKHFITQMMMGKSSVDNLIPFTVKTVSKLSLNGMNETNTEL